MNPTTLTLFVLLFTAAAAIGYYIYTKNSDDSCDDGKFKKDSKCTACKTCDLGTYKSGGCSGTTDTTCTACKTCDLGTYKSGGCSGTTDTTCTACTTCPDGATPTTPCRQTSDTVCPGENDGTTVSCNSANAFQISQNNCIDGSDIVSATPQCYKNMLSAAGVEPLYIDSCDFANGIGEKATQVINYLTTGNNEIAFMDDCGDKKTEYMDQVVMGKC